MIKRVMFDLETKGNAKTLALAPEPEISAPSNYKDPEKIKEYVEKETAAKKAELIARAGLDSDYGRIVSIGWAYIDEPDDITARLVGETIVTVSNLYDQDGRPIVSKREATEAEIIKEFWEVVSDVRGNLIGYNILSFDIPFLQARSMYLGIEVPWLLNLAKFRTEPITDLYSIRYNWAYGGGKSLKLLNKLLGIPNDLPDVNGAQVENMTPEELRKYQENDVKQIWGLYQKMNRVYFKHF